MFKMKRPGVLALLTLLNLSFVLGKSVHFLDCGRSFLWLSFFFHPRSKSCALANSRAYWSCICNTFVVLGLSLFRFVSDMGNEPPLISVFRNLGLACRMTLFLPGDPYILWMLPYKYRRRQNLGSIDPIVLNNKQNITRWNKLESISKHELWNKASNNVGWCNTILGSVGRKYKSLQRMEH